MDRNFLGKLFEYISDVLNSAERSFLDLLSVLVPYATPAIPAYLTFFHVQTEMDFPVEIAWVTAFVVEVLGITSVSTAIRFYRNNQMYKSTKEQAPFWLAVGTYAFYIVIVLAVNVVLEMVSGTRSGWVIFAIALFSLLSFPSGVLVSIRAQYSEVLEDRNERKASRRNLRGVSSQSTHTYAVNSKVPEQLAQRTQVRMGKRLDLRRDEGKLRKDRDFILNAPVKDVQDKYQVSRKTITNWRSALK